MENLIIMDKMKKLVDILNYHTRLYDEGHPEWSDKEWDEKYGDRVSYLPYGTRSHIIKYIFYTNNNVLIENCLILSGLND